MRKKKQRRGGKRRKGPASSSSTASTAVPDDPDSDGPEDIADGWSAAPVKKPRNQKVKEENAVEGHAQLLSSTMMSTRSPPEEDLSDEWGDFSDLYYSQKGQRHNFTRKDKQRHNHRDVTRIACAVETRMKQSAVDRGLTLCVK